MQRRSVAEILVVLSFMQDTVAILGAHKYIIL